MTESLISGYLERISSEVFDDYHKEITRLVGNQRGVYALYKKNSLYYVGLATNLRTRVKQHLKDRHAKKWDSFSLYLIRNVDRLKEIESILIRISGPKGNLTRGSLPIAGNMFKQFKRAMQDKNKQQLEKILTAHKKKVLRKNITPLWRRKRTLRERISGKKVGMLNGLLPLGTELRVTYKKQQYTSFVDEDGRIKVNDKVWNSPSSAGSAITGKPIDGWHFWKYLNAEGKWVKIDELRKGNR